MPSAMAQEAHIRKRQYQPSINSYFNNRDAPSSSAPEHARSPMSPPLPEDTQTSLLSVGMRVRKSVPEGYRTHKTMGMPEPPVLSTAPFRNMRMAYRNVPTKELMPFCGLHKTGGWGAQEVPSSSAPAVMGGLARDEEDMPGLSMSQGTLSSTQASFGANDVAYTVNSRKRTYDEEVEDDLDAYFDDIDAEQTNNPTARPFARMKQQGKKEGQAAAVRLPGGNDFEDAVFLAPADGMDVDRT